MSQSVVSPIVMPELVDTSQGPANRPIDVLGDVPAQVVVIAGRTQLSFAELRDIEVGDVLALDRSPDATVDVHGRVHHPEPGLGRPPIGHGGLVVSR